MSPPSAVVSIVIPDDVRDVRESFCNSVHYFVSRDAASGWLEKHPDGLLLPVEDAFTVGTLRNREIVGPLGSLGAGAKTPADGVGGCCG